MIADVAVPVVGVEGALSYAVPRALAGRAHPGVRVVVPVGGRRVVGLVVSARAAEEAARSEGPADGRPLRQILEVLDAAPVVDARQLELVRFVASYYLAGLGACARLVLPPDTGGSVERRFRLTERGEQARVFADAMGLGPADRAMLAAFAPEQRMDEREIARGASRKARLAALVAGGFIEEVATERAAGAVRHEETLAPVAEGAPGVEALPRGAPALAAFDAWLRAVGSSGSVFMAEAQAAHSGARGKVKRLEALGRLRVERRIQAGHVGGVAGKGLASTLTPAQAQAVARIEAGLDRPDGAAFLLEGVTGSGKTEVYLRAVRAALARGRGAIILVPEIGLTPQLVGRVAAALADRPHEVVVLHSGISTAERRDGLARLREGSARVAVGARSALFAPAPSLGLIIVDEEHDPSLKQDETPRYHARDVALWRARNEGAVVVLGSATPSLESRHNVVAGKLELLELPARVGGGGRLPHVEVIDLRARGQVSAQRRRDRQNADEGPGVVLSAPLVEAMGRTLAEGDQVLLFLNKRGYSAAIFCEQCGRTEECPHCSVALTLHRSRGALVCHQCDHVGPIPEACVECGNDDLLALGLGTERLEAEVAARFPDARLARLDRDAVRGRAQLEDVLRRIHGREVDIVVGTQMIAKGHDFPGVTLVGVVLADVALALPDFRAAERAFALLTQVAGRAGRSDKPGRVLIQTYKPEAAAIVFASSHDVRGFAAQELREREAARYPPYWRAALLRVEAEDGAVVPHLAADLAGRLQALASRWAPGTAQVLGPAPCVLERLQKRTRWQVFVRAPTAAARHALADAARHDDVLRRALQRARARLVIDLDPVHLL